MFAGGGDVAAFEDGEEVSLNGASATAVDGTLSGFGGGEVGVVDLTQGSARYRSASLG